MAGGANQQIQWPLEAAWEAAVEVTSAAFRLAPGAIKAESRGRGPRPPEAVREPKKLAIYITVLLAGCEYAALARHVGLHKDTVTSHCATVRDLCAEDDRTERLVEALGSTALIWLEAAGPQPEPPPEPSLLTSERVDDLQTFILGVLSKARKSATDEEARFIRRSHPTAKYLSVESRAA